jgi:hypothetical protein
MALTAEMKKYVEALCKEKGYTDAQTVEAIKVFEADDEKLKLIQPILELPIGRASEFSKAMDTARSAHQQNTTWFANAKKTYDDTLAENQKLKETVDKYSTQYGQLNVSGGEVQTPPKTPATGTKSVEELIREKDDFYVQLQADLGDIRTQHFDMFGKIINDRDILTEMGKAANDPVNPRNITAKQAYQSLHGEAIKAKQEQAQKDRDEKLRAEGRAEARRQIVQNGGKLGAEVRETSTLFGAIASDGDKKNEDRNRNDEDRISLLEQDLLQETSKLAGATT